MLENNATKKMIQNILDGTTPPVQATKATQDGNGNNIANTYVTKTTPLRGILYANTDLKLSQIIGNTTYWNRPVEILPTDYEIKVGDIFIDRLGSVGVVTNSNTSSGSVAIQTISTTSVDGDGNNIADTYVDKASEQVITGRKIFYGDVTPLNVKYETQESGDTFSYAPVSFYDNADKKLGAVQGQKTGNGTVQAGIDVYDKDGNYVASMGLKWDHSTQKAFPFAPSGQDVVPNGDSSDKIVCSEFLQPGLLYANGVNYGYRGKSYNIVTTSTITYNGGSLRVTRSGNIVKIGGWIKTNATLNNGTGYTILTGIPTAADDIVGSFTTSEGFACYGRLFIQGNSLLLASNFNDSRNSIPTNTWISFTAEYVATN